MERSERAFMRAETVQIRSVPEFDASGPTVTGFDDVHERPTLVLRRDRMTSTLREQIDIMRRVGDAFGMEAVRSLHRCSGAVLVGPARTMPVLTPHGSADADRWYADFAIAALSTVSRSMTIWPLFLDRRERLRRDPAPAFYWSWSRFRADADGKSAVGRRSLDAMLAACMHHPGLVREVFRRGYYIRVPYLMIGPDLRADFPVLYWTLGTIVLSTRSRSRVHRSGLRACTFDVLS